MSSVLRYMGFVVLIYTCHSALALRGSRRRRDAPCNENTEYFSNNICCVNCPAGKHVESHCTRSGEMGKCVECDYGKYTEHPNGLKACLPCKQCRSDQEIVRECTQTQDTKCQCKVGRFCAHDQACEVCKKCSRCEKDEVKVRNCTSTTDTQCKKIQPRSPSASVNPWIWVGVVPAAVVVIVVTTICFLRHRDMQRRLCDEQAGEHTTEGGRNGLARGFNCSNLIVSRQPVSAATEDECKKLCESLSSSASNSRHSLTILPCAAFTAPPARASPAFPQQPDTRDDEQFPKLIPVNGEESLRKSFDYFEDIDIDCHKRFFRHLGITDNVIKSKEHLTYEDKIHELLNVWVEKEGRDASLNDLLTCLLSMNQRRTAETIKENAIDSGQYTCEN
ncbi:hypothetical protein PAMA_018808 [Pampus argenteus]